MSASRFGGFRIGRRSLTEWDILKSPSSDINQAPSSILDFRYVDSQGIWSIISTMQFPKNKGSSYTLGLSESLYQTSGDSDGWSQKTVDISSYSGATVRLVYKYTMVASVFTADMQLDAINIDGTTYSFENSGQSWQTSTTNTGAYDSVSWSNLSTGTTAGRWNVDSGGTPTGSTARTDAAAGSYYVYAETSSPGNVSGFVFWLRSPEIVLGSSPTLTYYETRTGTSLGNLDVYLDVIS